MSVVWTPHKMSQIILINHHGIEDRARINLHFCLLFFIFSIVPSNLLGNNMQTYYLMLTLLQLRTSRYFCEKYKMHWTLSITLKHFFSGFSKLYLILFNYNLENVYVSTRIYIYLLMCVFISKRGTVMNTSARILKEHHKLAWSFHRKQLKSPYLKVTLRWTFLL